MARVLVTGATGFIASHCLLALKKRGHEVRGTARSTARAEALNAMLSDYAGERVEVPLVAADLTSDAGWADAMDGVDTVFHVASPIPANLPRDAETLIRPAREGTLRVLKAAKRAGISRVVMTSSVAAIAYGWGESRPDPLTEDHWSNPDNLKDNTAYTRSKTLSELAAWEYVGGEGEGLDLTTINPSAVLGPVMSTDFSASLELITQLMGGKLPAVPRMGFQIVDVRDVAEAHVLAMETPEAAGRRYIVAGDFVWFSELADLLRARFPGHARKVPKGTLPSWLVRFMAPFNPPVKQILPELDKRRNASSARAEAELGWTGRSAEEAAIASAESLIEKGAI